MNMIQSFKARSLIALAMLLGFLVIQSDLQAVASASSEDVPIIVQVTEPAPQCADSIIALSFMPTVEYSTLQNPIYIVLPDTTSDVATVDLRIMPGQTADCDSISGYVTFSESGFTDGNEAISFLSTVYECDNALLGSANGVFTCGQGDTEPPSVITVTVEAGAGAVQGYFTNTLSINLIANP